MKKRLTDRFLQTVAPPASGRITYSDTEVRGLDIRISAPDKYDFVLKAWSIRYRPKGGERTRSTYGSYPEVLLGEARARAKEIAAAAARGLDLPEQEERQREEQHRAEERPQNLGALIDRYIEQHCRPMQRRSGVVERLFARHVPPRMAATPLDELRRADLVELLDDLQNKKGLKAQVNRVREHLIAALNWAVDREFLEVNPFAGVKKRKLEARRTRVFTDRELRAVWRAAEVRPVPGSAFVKVLILTGQRRDEVRCMMWSEVDIDRAVWVLPAARNKGKREHEIPLSPAVLALMGKPRPSGPVFTLNGKVPYAGLESLKRFLGRESGVSNWTYHDIRRTVASSLAALHVSQDIIERVLNHAMDPLAQTYNRHEYLNEKRRALELWADRVAVIVGDGRDAVNVVELRAGT
jgi:integrase